MKYGLIGEHLTHSYSCEIHAQIADYEYELHELRPDELGEFMTKREFNAINVTIPYKQDVIPYLDEISGNGKAHRRGEHRRKPQRQALRRQHRFSWYAGALQSMQALT